MFVSHLRKQHWQLVTKCFLCYDMSAFSVYTASFKYWPPTSPLSPQIYGVWMLCLPSTPNVFKRKLLNVIVPGASSTCFLFLLNEVSWEANKKKKNHLKILRIDGACATFWTKLLVSIWKTIYVGISFFLCAAEIVSKERLLLSFNGHSKYFEAFMVI